MAEFTRDQPRRPAVRNTTAYVAWGRAHPFCAACGREGGGAFGISTHHIVGGSGGRSDEPCNLLRMCMHPCHDLAEKLDVRGPARYAHDFTGAIVQLRGELLPKITLGIALSMKLRCDPNEVDWDRLQELRGRRLPDLEHFINLWRRNRPEVSHDRT